MLRKCYEFKISEESEKNTLKRRVSDIPTKKFKKQQMTTPIGNKIDKSINTHKWQYLTNIFPKKTIFVKQFGKD